MQRRRFLAGVAGTASLLAGCAALGDVDADRQPFRVDDTLDPSTDSTDDESGGEETIVDGHGIDINSPTVVDFETDSLTASVVDGRIRTDDRLALSLDFAAPETADSPARLAGTLANNKSFEQTFRPRRVVAFDDPPRAGTDDGTTIYLAPTEATPFAETVPESVRDEDGRWRIRHVREDWYPETITLGGGETIEVEFVLLGHHDETEPPIEAGRYEFGSRNASFTVAVWPTDRPGPSEKSALQGTSVPPLPDEDGTRWYHETTVETETFLRSSAAAIETPGVIDFEFVNRSRDSVGGNPAFWRLYKLVDGKWLPIEPWVWNAPLSFVNPGGVETRTLLCTNGEPIRAEALGSGGVRPVGHLGGGRYAYQTGYRVDGIAHAAVFDIEAPALSVPPPSDATVVDEDDRITVRLPEFEDASDVAAMTVTRLEAAEPSESNTDTTNSSPSTSDDQSIDAVIIEEQLPRRPFRAFRNAFPHFEPGVETVVVEADRSTILLPFDYDEDEPRTIEYDGERYVATGALLEGTGE